MDKEYDVAVQAIKLVINVLRLVRLVPSSSIASSSPIRSFVSPPPPNLPLPVHLM